MADPVASEPAAPGPPLPFPSTLFHPPTGFRVPGTSQALGGFSFASLGSPGRPRFLDAWNYFQADFGGPIRLKSTSVLVCATTEYLRPRNLQRKEVCLAHDSGDWKVQTAWYLHLPRESLASCTRTWQRLKGN